MSSEQMTDIEWLEFRARGYAFLAEHAADAGKPTSEEMSRTNADRCRRIAATLREYADLRERLEGLMAEAERLVELQSKATEGPWEFHKMYDWSISGPVRRGGCSTTVVRGENLTSDYIDPEEAPIGKCEDGDLIAAARNTTLPADLLKVIGEKEGQHGSD